MAKHPTILPDDMVCRLAELAREHGYGIKRVTLSWLTKDLGQPGAVCVTYDVASLTEDEV